MWVCLETLFVYLDDLIIARKDSETHLKNLKAVLQRLQDVGLKVILSKCEFLKAKILFLGHEVDGEGIHTSDYKIKAVKNCLKPQSVQNVCSFLEFARYY